MKGRIVKWVGITFGVLTLAVVAVDFLSARYLLRESQRYRREIEGIKQRNAGYRRTVISGDPIDRNAAAWYRLALRHFSVWLGQEKILSEAVNEPTRSRLDVGPAPRGGNGETVNNTSNSDNQSSGASFRIIADLENWDLSLGTNSPGQSGDPASPHYRDLFELWAKGKYFPVYFTRSKVEAAARSATVLKPAPSGTK